LKIYFDNCCFNRPFDNQKNIKIFLETHAKLYIQQKILEGKYELVWSYILEFENEQNPFELRRKAILQWKNLASEFVEENDEILNNSDFLIRKGLKPKDALHVSCAKYAGCDCFFTTDKGILKKSIDKIQLFNPVDFVEFLEDNNENR